MHDGVGTFYAESCHVMPYNMLEHVSTHTNPNSSTHCNWHVSIRLEASQVLVHRNDSWCTDLSVFLALNNLPVSYHDLKHDLKFV